MTEKMTLSIWGPATTLSEIHFEGSSFILLDFKFWKSDDKEFLSREQMLSLNFFASP